MKRFIELLFFIMLITLILLCCSSCSLLKQGTVPIPELTSLQQVTKTLAKTNWLVPFAIIGIGAGFFSFLNGHSKGLQAMAACFVVLSVTLAIARYSSTISLVAAIGSVALVLYTILVKNKALKEIITGVEKTKEIFQLFNKDGNIVGINTDMAINESQDEAQSKTTKQIVTKIKNGG